MDKNYDPSLYSLQEIHFRYKDIEGKLGQLLVPSHVSPSSLCSKLKVYVHESKSKIKTVESHSCSTW